MRISGGSAARRILKAPKGLDVRPTPDLVKQALFNSLGARIHDARVLELFGGSGALSLESLSRGAKEAVCIEKSNRTAQMIRQNLQSLGLDPSKFELRTQDVFTALGQLRQASRHFDLILADPPYGPKNIGRRSESDAQKLLDHEALPGLLAEDGLFVLGHSKRDTLTIPPPWREVKMLKHGDSILHFFTTAAAIPRSDEPQT